MKSTLLNKPLPTKSGGSNCPVPCAQCRAPVFVHTDKNGVRYQLNPDKTPHICKKKRESRRVPK